VLAFAPEPRQRVSAGRNTDQLLRYGYHYWNQLFNARQLAALDLLFRAIKKVEDENARETLLLLASTSLEFNSMLCSSKGLGTGAIRQVFTHHAFIPAKCPFEANVWGVKSSSGGFATLYHSRVPRAVAWAENPVEPRPRKNGKTEKLGADCRSCRGTRGQISSDVSRRSSSATGAGSRRSLAAPPASRRTADGSVSRAGQSSESCSVRCGGAHACQASMIASRSARLLTVLSWIRIAA
jgi:hypothetical protein